MQVVRDLRVRPPKNFNATHAKVEHKAQQETKHDVFVLPGGLDFFFWGEFFEIGMSFYRQLTFTASRERWPPAIVAPSSLFPL